MPLPCVAILLSGCTQSGNHEDSHLVSSESRRTDGSDGDTDSHSPRDLPAEEVQLCGPAAGGPHWLVEGESIQAQVSCFSGLQLPGSDFTFSALPDGAVYNAATGTLHWTPDLSQAAVYEIEIHVDRLNEVGSVKIGVADNFDHPQNVPILDATTYTEEYGLPVLHLQPTPALTREFYTPAKIIYGGHIYTAEAKRRGASSLEYPKNSYTLKFTKEDKFNDEDAAGGFVEKRKIVLTTTFDDNTYIRQRLAFSLWNRLDPNHIQVQAYNAVVFLEGQYHGLYMVGDHIDGYLMEDHGLWQDGNLFKARTHDANFRLTQYDEDPKATLHDGLSKSEGFPVEGEEGDFDDLDEFIDFVANSNSQTFATQINTRINLRDYENWWIFATAISAEDSLGKNSYHYHDPNGGPWRLIPWDFNHSFGQDWLTLRVRSDAPPEDATELNNLFARMLEEPTIGPQLRARYLLTLENQYRLEDILSLIDLWYAQNLQSALRDQSKWGEAYFQYEPWNWRTDFLSHEQEVEYLRDWLTARWAFLVGLG